MAIAEQVAGLNTVDRILVGLHKRAPFVRQQWLHMSRKLDLENIRASLNTPCPRCGHSITPEERTHVDTENLECPQCRKRFVPGKPEQSAAQS